MRKILAIAGALLVAFSLLVGGMAYFTDWYPLWGLHAYQAISEASTLAERDDPDLRFSGIATLRDGGFRVDYTKPGKHECYYSVVVRFTEDGIQAKSTGGGR